MLTIEWVLLGIYATCTLINLGIAIAVHETNHVSTSGYALLTIGIVSGPIATLVMIGLRIGDPY